MSENGDPDWDALEEEHRPETEHTDRAHEQGETFADVVAKKYGMIDDGELSPTESLYDKHTAAQLAALEETGQLSDLLEKVQAEIEMEGSGQATKSQLLIAALRYTIDDVDPDLLDDARDGYAEAQSEPF